MQQTLYYPLQFYKHLHIFCLSIFHFLYKLIYFAIIPYACNHKCIKQSKITSYCIAYSLLIAELLTSFHSFSWLFYFHCINAYKFQQPNCNSIFCIKHSVIQVYSPYYMSSHFLSAISSLFFLIIFFPGFSLLGGNKLFNQSSELIISTQS